MRYADATRPLPTGPNILSMVSSAFDRNAAQLDIQREQSYIVVAVLDTGVAYEDYDVYLQAPDLAGTTFVPGYDFINDDEHANDDHWYGTHVTGTIAQTTNNAYGVAGLAFNVSIMPVKVLGADGSGTVAAVVDGINFAINNGAHVINLSLSGPDYTQSEADAIAAAYEAGVVVVAAAARVPRGKRSPISGCIRYTDCSRCYALRRDTRAILEYWQLPGYRRARRRRLLRPE